MRSVEKGSECFESVMLRQAQQKENKASYSETARQTSSAKAGGFAIRARSDSSNPRQHNGARNYSRPKGNGFVEAMSYCKRLDAGVNFKLGQYPALNWVDNT